jgi:subtilase family serine protease
MLSVLFVLGGFSAYAQQEENNVPRGIQLAKDLGLADASAEIDITVHLKLNDKAAFDKAVDALYDPASPTFHKWMSDADLRMYAPAEKQRQIVRQELEKHGLTVLSTDKFGFTIRARGTMANVESAFNTEIHQFEYNGSTYRANVRNARLTGEAGEYVATVAGIESHQAQPLAVRAIDPRAATVKLSESALSKGFPPYSTTDCLSAPATYTLQGSTPLPTAVYTGTGLLLSADYYCDYLPNQLWTAMGLDEVYAAGYTGAGQTIVLVEAYGYPTLEKDANAFFKMANLPQLNSSNFSIVYPEGKPSNPNLGILERWNSEMAMDVEWSHSVAPGANIVVVISLGNGDEDFQYVISYATENNLGNSVSNSYEENEDILAGPLEQTSWDDTLEVASAKGISVNFSVGDSGDNGLGTPLGAPGVPAVDPHATAIGGTSILNDVANPGSTITTAWGDRLIILQDGNVVLDPPQNYGFVYGGGGGESVFWPKPSWQHALPGTGRQTPDVSALADLNTGVPIVITRGRQQNVEFGWGGTSLSCPIFSAFWAIANEKAGHPLGQAAPAIAALPYGGVQDVLPTTDSTPDNVTGVITDQNGSTTYSASDLFSGLLYGNKGFTSAITPVYLNGNMGLGDFGFGLDSSLTVRRGWDNATGWGTPYGLTFINAVTAK